MSPQQTESFVPLTAAPTSLERREFRVSVISTAAPPQFHSLETTAPGAGHTVGSRKLCEPRVSVQRDAGRVTHLRIQCGCGQVMDLACVYDDPPPATEC
jgi:hypothetical protein